MAKTRRAPAWALGILATAWTCAAVAQPAADGAKRVAFTAWVEVAADGRVDVSRVAPMTGELADVVRERLAATAFVPAQGADGPTSKGVAVGGTLVATPRDGARWEFALDHLATGPRVVAQTPIRMPPDAVRSGTHGAAEAVLRIGDDGRVEGVELASVSDRVFRPVLSDALRRWRFDPATAPRGSVARVAVTFEADGAKGTPPEVRCAVDPAEPHLRDGDGCADRVRVVGSRVRRG